MKKLFALVCMFMALHFGSNAQSESAYFSISTRTGDMEELVSSTEKLLVQNGFKVIGKYHPGERNDLAVLCYTHNELEKLALTFEDRGALASVLKVGFREVDGEVSISMINPMYLFYAYFVEDIDEVEGELRNISDKAKQSILSLGTGLAPFGGTLDKKKLQKYHYKVMMPYFKDAEELAEFSSFDQGLEVLRRNLVAGKGSTVQVYELVYPEKEVAVFGVGLFDADKGEGAFLPVIGEDHVAAMPYEIILQGEEASILPGRYRIALHWPELTMGTFMKIMSTPGDIKDVMKGLVTER